MCFLALLIGRRGPIHAGPSLLSANRHSVAITTYIFSDGSASRGTANILTPNKIGLLLQFLVGGYFQIILNNYKTRPQYVCRRLSAVIPSSNTITACDSSKCAQFSCRQGGKQRGQEPHHSPRERPESSSRGSSLLGV